MKVKTIVDEDFVNYKKPSMFIGAIYCDGKCCKEAGIPLEVCQNYGWRESAPVEIDNDKLCRRYLDNDLTAAIVIGGLEPMVQMVDLLAFIDKLRNGYHCDDDIVIYTGYYPEEVKAQLSLLRRFNNVVVKFGRFIPDAKSRYDDVLGITLISDNQYAERIS